MDGERARLVEELRTLERHMAEIARQRKEANRHLDAETSETRDRISAIQGQLHDIGTRHRSAEQLAHVFMAVARKTCDPQFYDQLLALACQEMERPGSILPLENARSES